MDKESLVFEPQASFKASHFLSGAIGKPKASGSVVAFFCLLFLAKQEK